MTPERGAPPAPVGPAGPVGPTGPGGSTAHYGGLLVVVDRPRFVAVLADLERLPGVEVFARDPETGRAVVVQESADEATQEELHRRIREVPGVLSADLVYHVVDREPTSRESAGGS